MSYVVAAPELITSAATDLATIGANVTAAHLAAAAPTLAVLPAAADEVSASIAHLFSQHAATYQGMAAQAAAFSDQFVQHLSAGALSYASTEATAAALLPFLPDFPATIASLWHDVQDSPSIIASLAQEQLVALLSPFFTQLVAGLILSDPFELWALRSTFPSTTG